MDTTPGLVCAASYVFGNNTYEKHSYIFVTFTNAVWQLEEVIYIILTKEVLKPFFFFLVKEKVFTCKWKLSTR